MKVYKIKALRFQSDANLDLIDANEDSLYIVQAMRTRHKTTDFTIWEDEFGDAENGEHPIDAGLNVCHSLEEARKILLDKGLILESAVFIDIED